VDEPFRKLSDIILSMAGITIDNPSVLRAGRIIELTGTAP